MRLPLRARAAVLVAGGVLAVAAGLRATRRAGPAASARSARAAVPTALGFRAGEAYRYALHVRSDQQVTTPGGDAVTAKLALDGDLVLRCYEASASGARLGLSLERMSTASLSIRGAQLARHPKGLDGEAYVVLDPHGAPLKLLVPRDASDLFKNVIPNIAALTRVTLPREPAATWEAGESTMLGRARSQYVASEDDPTRLVRYELGYDTLFALPRGAKAGDVTVDAADTVTLDDAAVPRHIAIAEHATLATRVDARVDARLDLVDVSPFEAPAPADTELESYAPDERRLPSGDAKEQALRALAGDMTMKRLEAIAFGYVPGAQLPSGAVTAAVAMLKLDPALCEGLVEWFERAGASLATRALLLDLLASAGHAQAQAAMRDALSSAAARTDPSAYGTLLQRLGVIVLPDRATVDFVYATYAASRGDVHLASAYALGATIGARGPASADPAVHRYADRLRDDLRAAKTPSARVALLAALGNAGRARDVALIRGFSRDADAHVRRQAAIALRRGHTKEVNDALFDMLGDVEISVSGAALSSLTDDGASAEVMHRLVSVTSSSALPAALHEPLLSIVGAETKAYPDEAAAILRAIRSASSDPHTIARAQMLLDQLGRARSF